MKFRDTITLFVASFCLSGLWIDAAHAQYFSNHDGFTDSGGYRIQTELMPYLWLPATSGKVGFSRQAINNRFSGGFSSAVPSASQLADSLHFSFMGAGVMRYGPYSTELDMQYVNGSQSKDIPTRIGPGLRGKIYASYFRIAPGLGYQVYSGDIIGIPASADARIGFAYFTYNASLKGEGRLAGEVKSNGDFVQPWLGGRMDFVPSPRWRIELGALVQGLGVENGSWGWEASLIGSYAFNDWLSGDLGFDALSSERESGNRDTSASEARTLELTAYGPVFGVSLRF